MTTNWKFGPRMNESRTRTVVTDRKAGHDLIAETIYYEQTIGYGGQKWTNTIVEVAPHCTCGWKHYRAYQRTEYVTFWWNHHLKSVTKIPAMVA